MVGEIRALDSKGLCLQIISLGPDKDLHDIRILKVWVV